MWEDQCQISKHNGTCEEIKFISNVDLRKQFHLTVCKLFEVPYKPDFNTFACNIFGTIHRSRRPENDSFSLVPPTLLFYSQHRNHENSQANKMCMPHGCCRSYLKLQLLGWKKSVSTTLASKNNGTFLEQKRASDYTTSQIELNWVSLTCAIRRSTPKR